MSDEPARCVVDFAHNSERQFSKLLDFYSIEWQYEPVLFILSRDERGRISEAFSPDFFLPSYRLFVEITTLKQSLVTKKNRKARTLMATFPGVTVKVLYQRDYLNLLVKYGLEEPEQLDGFENGEPAGESTDSLLGLFDGTELTPPPSG